MVGVANGVVYLWWEWLMEYIVHGWWVWLMEYLKATIINRVEF